MKINEDIINFLDRCDYRLETVTFWDTDDYSFLYSKKNNKLVLEIKDWEFKHYKFNNSIKSFIVLIKKKGENYSLINGMSEEFVKVNTRKYKILLTMMDIELESMKVIC